MKNLTEKPQEQPQEHPEKQGPTIEKFGHIEVIRYPDKPDGTRGLRGFRMTFRLGGGES